MKKIAIETSYPECPKCGSKALLIGTSTSTLMFIPVETDDNGNIIVPKAKNIITTSYTCKKCGHHFEVKE